MKTEDIEQLRVHDIVRFKSPTRVNNHWEFTGETREGEIADITFREPSEGLMVDIFHVRLDKDGPTYTTSSTQLIEKLNV